MVKRVLPPIQPNSLSSEPETGPYRSADPRVPQHDEKDDELPPCPACGTSLELVPVGEHSVRECSRCAGFFVDPVTLAAFLQNHREGSGAPSVADAVLASPRFESEVRYRRCPDCRSWMQRTNFGRRSGIIVDVCLAHGTFFDAGELTRAFMFVRTLDEAEASALVDRASTEGRLARTRALAELEVEFAKMRAARPPLLEGDESSPFERIVAFLRWLF